MDWLKKKNIFFNENEVVILATLRTIYKINLLDAIASQAIVVLSNAPKIIQKLANSLHSPRSIYSMGEKYCANVNTLHAYNKIIIFILQFINSRHTPASIEEFMELSCNSPNTPRNEGELRNYAAIVRHHNDNIIKIAYLVLLLSKMLQDHDYNNSGPLAQIVKRKFIGILHNTPDNYSCQLFRKFLATENEEGQNLRSKKMMMAQRCVPSCFVNSLVLQKFSDAVHNASDSTIPIRIILQKL